MSKLLMYTALFRVEDAIIRANDALAGMHDTRTKILNAVGTPTEGLILDPPFEVTILNDRELDGHDYMRAIEDVCQNVRVHKCYIHGGYDDPFDASEGIIINVCVDTDREAVIEWLHRRRLCGGL